LAVHGSGKHLEASSRMSKLQMGPFYAQPQ